MKGPGRLNGIILPALAGLLLASACATSEPVQRPDFLVGLRRSAYGLPARATDDAWWVAQARAHAAAYAGARPAIIEIVSTYLDDGTTQFGFARPAADGGPVTDMAFHAGKVDHERALCLYDRTGVKAILQIEPGSADVERCLEVAWRAFGHHPCVVGFGIDGEWFRTKDSKDGAGEPVTDELARAWMEKVRSFHPRHTLFLKHFQTGKLPPTYRHPNLWFINDSQDFSGLSHMVREFAAWDRFAAGAGTGFQFGYPRDRKWWSKLHCPPVAIGRELRGAIPGVRGLFWVDFSADQVDFTAGSGTDDAGRPVRK